MKIYNTNKNKADKSVVILDKTDITQNKEGYFIMKKYQYNWKIPQS